MYVSVSAYEDGDLLGGCLDSIREVRPDATIAVVDGRYESWPAGADNSTDQTQQIATMYDADYIAGGPYERECDKHRHRVELAPAGERCLFMDADERLLAFKDGLLDDSVAYEPRIFNADDYGPRSVYWPRCFQPEWVQSINRWDAYLFDVECHKTDAITIVHRHDLRGRDYREAKVDRFENEGRKSRYADGRLDNYLEGNWENVTTACPRCGKDSVTRSQVTGYAPVYSVVESCTAEDRCYAAIRKYGLDEYQYLPDDWEAGLNENPERLRIELFDAGCTFVGQLTPEEFTRMETAIRQWVNHNLAEGQADA